MRGAAKVRLHPRTPGRAHFNQLVITHCGHVPQHGAQRIDVTRGKNKARLPFPNQLRNTADVGTNNGARHRTGLHDRDRRVFVPL